MFNTPFNSFSNTLQSELFDNNILEGIKWLLGLNINSGNKNKFILAQFGNSAWEASQSLMIFIRYKKIIEKNSINDPSHNSAVERIDQVFPELIKYLLECNCLEDNGMATWERVTWDTAVVVRALNEALVEYPDLIEEDCKINIKEKTNTAIQWLCIQFMNWENQVKYPFGYADVAQILHTLVFLYTNEIVHSNTKLSEKSVAGHIEDLCKFLLNAQRDEENTVKTVEGNEKVKSGWWDDPFTTAEVLVSLSLCASLYSNDGIFKQNYQNEIDEIKASINSACTYLEKSQVDGMWGSHIDTIKIVRAYIKVGKLIHSNDKGESYLEPEIHTTFKALRWIIDEKQILSDGSFLHTLFLTVFYVQTLLEVYESWEPAKKTIGELYDDVVWSSPTRSTPERSKRLDLELKNEKLERNYSASKQENSKKIWKLRQINNTLILFLLGVPLILTISYTTNLVTINITLNEADPYGLNTIVLASITIFIGLLTFVWRNEWKKIT